MLFKVKMRVRLSQFFFPPFVCRTLQTALFSTQKQEISNFHSKRDLLILFPREEAQKSNILKSSLQNLRCLSNMKVNDCLWKCDKAEFLFWVSTVFMEFVARRHHIFFPHNDWLIVNRLICMSVRDRYVVGVWSVCGWWSAGGRYVVRMWSVRDRYAVGRSSTVKAFGTVVGEWSVKICEW